MSIYEDPNSQPGQTVKHVPELVPGSVDHGSMPPVVVQGVSTYTNTGAGVGQTISAGSSAAPADKPTAAPAWGPAPGTVSPPSYVSVTPDPTSK